MSREKDPWIGLGQLDAEKYECGHCGRAVASERGWARWNFRGINIYVCPYCAAPTYFEGDDQIPGPMLGEKVDGLPDDVAELYRQARVSHSAGAYTSAILICRKLLMHTAVTKGAEPNLNFIRYVDYLNDAGYVPPDGKPWVKFILKAANDENHQIRLATREEAAQVLFFTAMLLKFVYEMTSRLPKPREKS